MNLLDRIPYTPLLHLLALLATIATVIGDFVITFRNLAINQTNWDKFHDFLPWLFLWAAGQFAAKRATAWKPPETTSEVEKTPAAGQPAAPAEEAP